MHKMQSKVQYYGRIKIDPKPNSSFGINTIRTWFESKGWKSIQISGKSGPWEGESLGSRPWGIALSGTPQKALQVPIQGTIALESDGPGPVTVWFSAVWVGPDGTDVITIQKHSDSHSGYKIYDMFYSDVVVLRDGKESSGGAATATEEAPFFVPMPEKNEMPPSLTTPTGVPVSELWLEEGRLYEGTIKANANNVTVDNALQSLGFYGTNVNQKLAKGQTANFEGQWKRSTGNYNLRTAQYQVVSLQLVKLEPLLDQEKSTQLKPLPTQKESIQEAEESWQPSDKASSLRSEYEDTIHRDEQQENESEPESKSDNTVLWVLGILGVSVVGYLALKDNK